MRFTPELNAYEVTHIQRVLDYKRIEAEGREPQSITNLNRSIKRLEVITEKHVKTRTSC